MIGPSIPGDLVRWRRRLGQDPVSLPWATSGDVEVRAHLEPGHLHLRVNDLGDATAALAWSEITTDLWSWSAEPVVHDGWLGPGPDSTSVLHLHVPALKDQVVHVHCQWARHDARPLMVHLHLPPDQAVVWHDETLAAPWQRTMRVWHVAEGARVRLSNRWDDAVNGCAWWDDEWVLAADSQVAWVDHLGEAQDLRRRTRVALHANTVWRMASVGWLLPQRWHDHEMSVAHHGPRSESHLHHRTALLDRSQRRLTSCVSVDPLAIDGFTAQTMQHWPLSDQMVLTASPQLAIGIGAVRGATHGAAVGRFDPQVVQAMQARGLPLGTALRLMLEGALRHALDQLDDQDPWWDEQRETLHRRIAQGHWLDAAQTFWDHEQQQEHDDER